MLCTGSMERVLLMFALKYACQRTRPTVVAIMLNLAPSDLGSVKGPLKVCEAGLEGRASGLRP
ncbi:MAG: hypothetical protein QOF31_642 [Mycobacterium sp.]|nr:hypothetical protein [Mycobacterium sp.]